MEKIKSKSKKSSKSRSDSGATEDVDPDKLLYHWTTSFHLPIWKSIDCYPNCQLCGENFRKGHQHHCRLCGEMFCTTCTQKFYLPVKFNLKNKKGPLRVCHKCRDLCLEIKRKTNGDTTPTSTQIKRTSEESKGKSGSMSSAESPRDIIITSKDPPPVLQSDTEMETAGKTPMGKIFSSEQLAARLNKTRTAQPGKPKGLMLDEPNSPINRRPPSNNDRPPSNHNNSDRPSDDSIDEKPKPISKSSSLSSLFSILSNSRNNSTSSETSNTSGRGSKSRKNTGGSSSARNSPTQRPFSTSETEIQSIPILPSISLPDTKYSPQNLGNMSGTNSSMSSSPSKSQQTTISLGQPIILKIQLENNDDKNFGENHTFPMEITNIYELTDLKEIDRIIKRKNPFLTKGYQRDYLYRGIEIPNVFYDIFTANHFLPILLVRSNLVTTSSSSSSLVSAGISSSPVKVSSIAEENPPPLMSIRPASPSISPYTHSSSPIHLINPYSKNSQSLQLQQLQVHQQRKISSPTGNSSTSSEFPPPNHVETPPSPSSPVSPTTTIPSATYPPPTTTSHGGHPHPTNKFTKPLVGSSSSSNFKKPDKKKLGTTTTTTTSSGPSTTDILPSPNDVNPGGKLKQSSTTEDIFASRAKLFASASNPS